MAATDTGARGAQRQFLLSLQNLLNGLELQWSVQALLQLRRSELKAQEDATMQLSAQLEQDVKEQVCLSSYV